MIIFSPVRKIKAILHIGKYLDSLFKKEAVAHYTNFSPVRKIKAVMHIGKCLDSLFIKKALAHNTNFSLVRKFKAVMHVGKCLDSSLKKKAFAQCLSLKSCLSLHLYALLCRLSRNNLSSVRKIKTFST